jgi:hypothetical protein
MGEGEMTDRELLELAAKAAGITLEYIGEEWVGNSDELMPVYYEGKTYHSWSPLDDDGDAFRLACKLALVVYCDEVEAWCEWGELNENLEYEHHVSAEPQYRGAQSVRRAIVLAASEIGGQR